MEKSLNGLESKARWQRTFMAAVRLGLVAIPFVAAPLNAEELDPGLLSPSEVAFLQKYCPETTEVVDAGAALVYGNVITPPILVAREQGKIYVGGFRVAPRMSKPKNLPAQNAFDKIQTQFYLEKRGGTLDPVGRARERAATLVKSGRASNFEFLPGKMKRLSIRVGDIEAHDILDACPGPMVNKFAFIYKMLFRSYHFHKDADGKDAALAWLRARFDDLRAMGIVASYDLHENTEAIYLSESCSPFRFNGSGYGFYGPDTPKAEAYDKEWTSREPETKKQVAELVGRLKRGELLIYSYDFDAHEALKQKTLETLRAIRAGEAVESDKERVWRELGLTEKQSNAILKELE